MFWLLSLDMKVVARFLPLWLLVSQTFPAPTVNAASTIPDSPTAEAPAVVWDRELQEAPFDICYVCGNGKVVTLPDASSGYSNVDEGTWSCAQLENRGLSGQIDSLLCQFFATAIGETCGCLPTKAPTESPTKAPTAESPTKAPTLAPVTAAPQRKTRKPNKKTNIKKPKPNSKG